MQYCSIVTSVIRLNDCTWYKYNSIVKMHVYSTLFYMVEDDV